MNIAFAFTHLNFADCSNACHKLFVKHAIRLRVGVVFNMRDEHEHRGKLWKSFSRYLSVSVCVARWARDLLKKPLAFGLLRHFIIWYPYFVKFGCHRERHEIHNENEWKCRHIYARKMCNFSVHHLQFAVKSNKIMTACIRLQ